MKMFTPAIHITFFLALITIVFDIRIECWDYLHQFDNFNFNAIAVDFYYPHYLNERLMYFKYQIVVFEYWNLIHCSQLSNRISPHCKKQNY